MKVLVTGANGYIGQRLTPVLRSQGYELVFCVRNLARFADDIVPGKTSAVEIDFLDSATFQPLPREIEVAFYLIHSMSSAVGAFEEQEAKAAQNFLHLIEQTSCKQIIYLSGIVNEENLSQHLSSRYNVEKILRSGRIAVTVLRSGIVVGSGSASFEIIRDLVEKLPVMVAPRWLNTKGQPIGVRNVVEFLVGVMLQEFTFNKDFDIGGPEVLTYKEMLLQFAKVRGLKRLVITVPVMSTRLSSYWLYFVTSISYALAVNLVESMKVNMIPQPNPLARELGIVLLSYEAAVRSALEETEQRLVTSSWKDSFSSSRANRKIMQYIQVPEFGCFKDVKRRTIGGNIDDVWQRIWSIGGENGWYYADFLWEVRGLIDKVFGGVGLNRGRTGNNDLRAGDALDFWRVLVVDKQKKRLLLFAEMKLPGEAWLEFWVLQDRGDSELVQTATFRPKGLLGRLYWHSVLPFHNLIFAGLIDRLVETK